MTLRTIVPNPGPERVARSRARSGTACLLMLVAVCSGCASFKAPNQPLAQVDPSRGYRPTNASQFHEVGSIWLFVAFSGGGTRAAAFAYGVL